MSLMIMTVTVACDKRDGIGAGRIETFHFLLTPLMTVIYDLAKTRLSESEI